MQCTFCNTDIYEICFHIAYVRVYMCKCKIFYTHLCVRGKITEILGVNGFDSFKPFPVLPYMQACARKTGCFVMRYVHCLILQYRLVAPKM